MQDLRNLTQLSDWTELNWTEHFTRKPVEGVLYQNEGTN